MTKDRRLFDFTWVAPRGSYFFGECVPVGLSISGFWLGFSVLEAKMRRFDTADRYFFEMSVLLAYEHIKGY